MHRYSYFDEQDSAMVPLKDMPRYKRELLSALVKNGIDPNHVAVDGLDSRGYYEILVDDETGKRLINPKGEVWRVKRTWDEMSVPEKDIEDIMWFYALAGGKNGILNA